jgi:alpha-beta hydrolase superfamily lysophospholipase
VGLQHAEHPDLPLVLLAHSMGSFAVQQYLLDHSDEVTAVALTGTGLLDLIEPAMDLDQPLELAMFNAPFAPARTDYDWLSRDEAQVDAYLADPHCGFGLDMEGAKAMFAAARASRMRIGWPGFARICRCISASVRKIRSTGSWPSCTRSSSASARQG